MGRQTKAREDTRRQTEQRHRGRGEERRQGEGKERERQKWGEKGEERGRRWKIKGGKGLCWRECG